VRPRKEVGRAPGRSKDRRDSRSKKESAIRRLIAISEGEHAQNHGAQPPELMTPQPTELSNLWMTMPPPTSNI
jgi:hypothetical protein